MNFKFHALAKVEFNNAIDYYQECQSGLGLIFADEIKSTIHRILHFPKAWPELSVNTRRCLVNRFPFGVIYQIAPKYILIIAVTQLNRKPNYWQLRISNKNPSDN